MLVEFRHAIGKRRRGERSTIGERPLTDFRYTAGNRNRRQSYTGFEGVVLNGIDIVSDVIVDNR